MIKREKVSNQILIKKIVFVETIFKKVKYLMLESSKNLYLSKKELSINKIVT